MRFDEKVKKLTVDTGSLPYRLKIFVYRIYEKKNTTSSDVDQI